MVLMIPYNYHSGYFSELTQCEWRLITNAILKHRCLTKYKQNY